MSHTVNATFAASLCTVLVLALAMSACSNGAAPEASSLCGGGWPDLDKAIEEAEEGVDFEVLVPTYLPATTSSLPEATIHSREDVTLLFPPCAEAVSGVDSDVVGPAITIAETTQVGGLPEPGYSDPPTERIQIQGTPALIQRGSSPDTVSVGIGWQQRGLSMLATLTWQSDDTGPPEVTPQMETEALRVVESIIEQGS
jgi:hypothetical protein